MGAMGEEKTLPRPRQVTTASVVAVASSVLLVLSLADTLGRLRTAEARRSIAEVLADPPADGLGVSVEQVLAGLRWLVYGGGVLAAVTMVLAVFVAQRHRGARIGFTVAAVLLLVTLPVAGLMPLFLVLAAGMMWSRPARDWYAGRTAAPEQSASPAPFPPPPSVPPAATAPTAPFSGSGAHPYAGAAPYGGPSTRRPATVTAAVILTGISAAVTALGALLLMVVLAQDAGEFIRSYEKASSGRPAVQLTNDQLLAIGWALAAALLLWCLVAILLAVFAMRRSQGARIGLVVSAVLTAAVSLLAIISVVTVVPLLVSVAVVVLLFTGGANDWYARRPPAPTPPPGQPRPAPQRQKPW